MSCNCRQHMSILHEHVWCRTQEGQQVLRTGSAAVSWLPFASSDKNMGHTWCRKARRGCRCSTLVVLRPEGVGVPVMTHRRSACSAQASRSLDVAPRLAPSRCPSSSSTLSQCTCTCTSYVSHARCGAAAHISCLRSKVDMSQQFLSPAGQPQLGRHPQACPQQMPLIQQHPQPVHLHDRPVLQLGHSRLTLASAASCKRSPAQCLLGPISWAYGS